MKDLALEDQPTYKLLSKGKMAMTDSELLSMIIGAGTKEKNSLEIARDILNQCANNLQVMGRLTVGEMSKVEGMTMNKAAKIHACFELGNRKIVTDALYRLKISSSKDAYDIMRPVLQDNNYEEFWILMLNRANKFLSKVRISEGGMAGTVADPKKIFKIALESGASHLILAHNHPSGSTLPSEADIKLTQNLKGAGKLLEMPVIDHIIVAEDNYYSFADEGLM